MVYQTVLPMLDGLHVLSDMPKIETFKQEYHSKEAHLHTTLFLLSIFGGLAWAGIMGLFYGPIIRLLLVTTIEIYVDEFVKEDSELIGGALSSRLRNNDTQS